jgi:hypothetical protein
MNRLAKASGSSLEAPNSACIQQANYCWLLMVFRCRSNLKFPGVKTTAGEREWSKKKFLGVIKDRRETSADDYLLPSYRNSKINPLWGFFPSAPNAV